MIFSIIKQGSVVLLTAHLCLATLVLFFTQVIAFHGCHLKLINVLNIYLVFLVFLFKNLLVTLVNTSIKVVRLIIKKYGFIVFFLVLYAIVVGLHLPVMTLFLFGVMFFKINTKKLGICENYECYTSKFWSDGKS